MRNIICSEDRKCTLEPMGAANQSGGGSAAGGLAPGEEDYVIPLNTTSLKQKYKRQVVKARPRKQVGGGKKVEKGKGKPKPRNPASRAKAVKQKGRKPNKRKQTKKPAKWIAL